MNKDCRHPPDRAGEPRRSEKLIRVTAAQLPAKSLDMGLRRVKLSARPTQRSTRLARWSQNPPQAVPCQENRGLSFQTVTQIVPGASRARDKVGGIDRGRGSIVQSLVGSNIVIAPPRRQ